MKYVQRTYQQEIGEERFLYEFKLLIEASEKAKIVERLKGTMEDKKFLPPDQLLRQNSDSESEDERSEKIDLNLSDISRSNSLGDEMPINNIEEETLDGESILSDESFLTLKEEISEYDLINKLNDQKIYLSLCKNKESKVKSLIEKTQELDEEIGSKEISTNIYTNTLSCLVS